jgi:glycosyltransferase involved in cell wall biosynthesis
VTGPGQGRADRPLRVVLAHNHYGSEAPSGENAVFEAERRLLQERGHEVLSFERHSDEIRSRGLRGLATGALSTPWNPFAARRLRALLERERPDVLHVHNPFPLLSPAVFHAARGLPIATVWTLHNYRPFCAAATLMRDGAPCTECIDQRSPLPGLVHGCYRGSRAATLPLAAMIDLLGRTGTLSREVDAFVVLTDFQREMVIRAGLPAARVHVKPNFHPAPPLVKPWREREARVLFAGRLGPEKGVAVLLDAWSLWPGAPLLEIAGDGPERGALEARARRHGLGDRVRFLGQLTPEEVGRRMGGARLLAVPSLCFEGFPLVVRDAFAAGVPVVASRLGALTQIVEDGGNGFLFAPGDPADLRLRVAEAWSEPGRLEALGAAARLAFERRCTADRSYETLLDVYGAARAVRETAARGSRSVSTFQRKIALSRFRRHMRRGSWASR